MTNKISIVVNTCDSYHDVLPIFFSALKEKLDSKKTENNEYYVDLDSITTGSDKYFKINGKRSHAG